MKIVGYCSDCQKAFMDKTECDSCQSSLETVGWIEESSP